MLPAAASLAVSGFFGIAAEMMLLLMYQVRHGAMFGMASLFFGLYMLGLAGGSLFAGRVVPSWSAILRLKSAQSIVALLCIPLVSHPEFHSAMILGGMTLLISMIAGCEFPLLVRIAGNRPEAVSRLVAADNLPAMMAGAIAGIWLLPGLGIGGTWILLATLSGGFTVFLVLSKGERFYGRI